MRTSTTRSSSSASFLVDAPYDSFEESAESATPGPSRTDTESNQASMKPRSFLCLCMLPNSRHYRPVSCWTRFRHSMSTGVILSGIVSCASGVAIGYGVSKSLSLHISSVMALCTAQSLDYLCFKLRQCLDHCRWQYRDQKRHGNECHEYSELLNSAKLKRHYEVSPWFDAIILSSASGSGNLRHALFTLSFVTARLFITLLHNGCCRYRVQ